MLSTMPTSSAPMKAPLTEPTPADDDDDEGGDEHALAHADLDRQQGGGHDAGKAAEECAEGRRRW